MDRGETGRMLFACHCGIFAPLEQETTGGDPKYRKCDITSKFGKPIGPLTTLTTNDIQTDLFLTLTITELKFPKKRSISSVSGPCRRGIPHVQDPLLSGICTETLQ